MNIAFFTLFEGLHGIGTAALINSLVRSGFKGNVFLGYRGVLPSWARELQKKSSGDPLMNLGIDIHFTELNPTRHFGYEKPFYAREILRTHGELDGIVYADPDILILCNWDFIQNWLNSGVALCSDCNFPIVGKNHPWRTSWTGLIGSSGLSLANNGSDTYHNSGFFGISRENLLLLDNWCTLTETYERGGGETSRFLQHERTRAVTGDQDLLAAALMTFEGVVSTLGAEGMGFNGHFFILSHATQAQKPWTANFLIRALGGMSPSVTEDLFLEYSKYPLECFSKKEHFLKAASLKIAKLISRVWSRPSSC